MNRLFKSILADLYPSADAMRDLAREAGVPVRYVAFDDTPSTNADRLVKAAEHNHQTQRLQLAAWRHNPSNPWLAAIVHGRAEVESPHDIEAEWRAPREVITGGTSTMKPVSWLSDGWQASLAVVRIHVNRTNAYGTGFVLDNVWLVTNNHVLPTDGHAKSANVLMDYAGNTPPMPVRLSPREGFATSAEHDITVVAVAEALGEQRDFNADRLTTTTPGRYCQIIGHPAGDKMMVSAYHNTVTYADEDRVQYLTDTMPGSSGSPVFDEDWNLVAIHNSGGWMRVGDSNGQMGYANQGTPAKRVLELMGRLVTQ